MMEAISLGKQWYQRRVRETMSESTGKVTLVHRISITFNKQTGKFEGIPQKVRDTILAAGFTEEQVMDDPSLVKDLLYTLDLEEVLSSSLNISLPSNVEHLVSIKINPETGKLEGVPDIVKNALAKAGLTEEQVLANPSLAKDILYKIPLEFVLREGKADPNISLPIRSTHHVSITFNQQTGKFEGVPEKVRKALTDAGLTEEQVLNNPTLAQDVLYQLNIADVLAGINAPDPHISKPSNVSHNICITYDPEAKRFVGIPEKVRQAILDSGLTEEQVMDNPAVAKDILYELNLEDVLKGVVIV
eukprot:TRINITY_DN944_c0_g1_i12.p1 TRINITY_DN944_c0_g1~~TRINITY_DN944_c0_g1_i12.p1  ORF type:complete len:303 (-),score=67.16 TRINITY_DN944_c0_g1_i12:101-1009(-)